MVHYKLTYFGIRGLAEPIRLVFAAAGVEYEDHRLEREAWPALKPTTPLGQLPLLEVDGKVYNQSVSILRFLGNEFGLAGKTNAENIAIDIIADTITDLKNAFVEVFTSDEASKPAKLEKIKTESGPRFIKFLESQAKNGYLANGKLSWVDLYFYNIFEMTEQVMKLNLFTDEYPELQKVIASVKGNPNVKKWLETRPVTEH